MSKTKLKPCPFCGGEAEIVYALHDYNLWGVRCKNCDASVECSIEEDSEENAVKAWNTRKPVDDVLERLEKLKMAEYDDSDEEPEYTDVEDWYKEGESSGRYKAYHRAIEIVKEVAADDK